MQQKWNQNFDGEPMTDIPQKFLNAGCDVYMVMQGIENEIDGYISQFERACRQTAVFVTGGNGVRFVQHREVLRNDALVEIGLNRILLHHLRGAR